MARVSEEERVSKEQMIKFAEWLSRVRQDRELTQEQFAQQLGFSVSYYNALENARKNSTKRRLYQIAKKAGDDRIIEMLFGTETLMRLKREDEARQILEMPSSSHNEMVTQVPIHPIMQWWGYKPHCVAHIQRLVNPLDVTHGQLLYYADPDNLDQGKFLFADMTNPERPILETPEAVIVRYHELKDFKVIEDLGLDPKAINERFVMMETDHKLYMVTQIVDPVTTPFPDPIGPFFESEYSREIRRSFARYVVVIYHLFRTSIDKVIRHLPDSLSTDD